MFSCRRGAGSSLRPTRFGESRRILNFGGSIVRRGEHSRLPTVDCHARFMPRTDSASRVMRSTPERVFAALVDPEALTAWLPPSGMTGRFERFDARAGGSYRLVLTYADSSSASGKSTTDSDIVEARFVEVVPNLRVVQAVDFVSGDPAFAGTMTMTWELSAESSGTRVQVRADNVRPGFLRKITPRAWRPPSPTLLPTSRRKDSIRTCRVGSDCIAIGSSKLIANGQRCKTCGCG